VDEDLSSFVARSATESPAPRSPDLAVNPIMDMEPEDEAVITDEDEDDDDDGDKPGPISSGEGASHSVQQEDEEDDGPNLSLPTHASFVSSSPTWSAEYEVEASKNKRKGRVVEDSEDELDLVASPTKQGGKKKAPKETPDVTSIREQLQGVILEAPSKRVTRSRLKK